MNIILLGAPGCGKGTQAKMMAEQLNLPHISTGDLFRKEMQQETELGKQVKELISGGNLVPDEVTIAVLQERIKQGDCNNGFILDGFPRTLEQAQALDENNIKIDKVIFFNLKDETVMERIAGRALKENRPDDAKEEVVQNRIDVYKKQTFPLIEFYKNKGLLVEVDAEPSIEVVFDQVKQIFA